MNEHCCEWHSITCEPPSELCCEQCPEVAHPDHTDGSVCVRDNPVYAQAVASAFGHVPPSVTTERYINRSGK